MRTRRLAVVTASCLLLTGVAGASGGPDDIHSSNIRQIATAPIMVPGGERADGSDLAFEGDLIVAGSYSGTGFFKIVKGPPYVKQIGFHNCAGGQGDVNVYKDLAFVALDSPQGQAIECEESDGMEGVRILDISNPAKPRQVQFVATDCGAHTQVINPSGDKIYIYVMSYPLGVQTATCSAASHRKVSIIEVPIAAPEKAKVVGFLDVSPEIGCHDVTIFPTSKLAAAACISETQIWDVSKPDKPVIISRIYNPSIGIHHGTALTWDEKYLAIADEFAGSVTGECAGDQRSPAGAMWFYDISDPTLPLLAGYYNIPRRSNPETADEVAYMACTTHNFNILPMKEKGSYIAAVGYRSAGLSIVDFSDPADPKEIGYYLQLEEGLIPDLWAGYWYNGRIYTNDNGASRGLSVYEMKGLGAEEVRFFKDRLNPQVQATTLK
jgi:hypothetical protein